MFNPQGHYRHSPHFFWTFPDVGHLQDVLPQMLRNMLRAVDASVEETFMPIVRRIARVPHTHDVLLMRIATHEADAMHERLKQMCA